MADAKGEPEEKKEERADETMVSNNHIKITDLNQFCLEKIFAYLPLEDLLNVSDSNKYLRSATRMPFVWSYARKSVRIDLQCIMNYDTDKEIIMFEPYTNIPKQPGDEDIVIVDLKKSFQILRCFGGLIIELNFFHFSFSNKKKSKNYNRIMSYIGEFCAESLKKVSFHNGSGFEGFEKPFLNVEDLTIHFVNLKEKCLSSLFPKLNRLHFNCFRDNALSVLSEYFPNLHHLKLGMGVSVFDNLATIFQLNPHIRSLSIGILSLNNFKSFSERYLQSIESLHISSFLVRKYNYCIHLSNVEKFKIRYVGDVYFASPKIPFSFNELKEFEIESNCTLPEFFITFINENPSIEKLTLTSIDLLKNVLRTGDLEAALPFLKDIILDDVIDNTKKKLCILLRNLEFLKSFTFRTRDMDEEIWLVCGDKWRFYRNEEYNRITLQRNEANV
ncbi:uncharacterized protein LOC129578327 [Sitodiplosis mosellana]|uniref:uncharacterized protein LOC129578327 n=1 Tax=Sitodiplosis mosellana TaxID=263140 RepID=UPI002443BDE7|nr:uncharacterized protein LOC129578327 [Sitodiplosis mosellana]